MTELLSDPAPATDGSPPPPPPHQPTNSRWQPLRLGLVDIFYYDDEIFPFVDGRLLLRGNNGAGKSKVLALTLPFLLDGDLSPQRVEPDGDRQKRMEWNLLLGDEHPHNERTGYTWLEFGRLGDDGVARTVTIGAGLKAARGRGITKHWFFVTEQRVGDDLALVDSSRVALSSGRLAEAIGDRGRVYETKAEYRRAVDERLFGLGERRYGELIELLLQMRAPQLSKRPSEKALDDALTGALPPVGDDVLKAVADGLRSLDEEREELAALVDTRRSVEAFLGHYRAYARVLLRRQAEGPRREQAEHDRQGREIIALVTELETASAAIAETIERVAASRVERTEREAEREALRDSEYAQHEHNLRAYDEKATQAEAFRDRAYERADAARAALQRATHDAASAGEHEAHRRVAAEASLDHLAAAASGAGLDARSHRDSLAASVDDLAGGAGDALAADRGRTAERISRVRGGIDRIRELLGSLERADSDLAAAAERDADADSRAAATTDRAVESAEAVEAAVDAHIEEVEIVLAAFVELSVPDDRFAEFTEWVRRRDGENPAVVALRAVASARRGELHAVRAELESRRTRLAEERTTLADEIAALERGVTDPPPVTHVRVEPTAVPLWRAVGFTESLADDERAGIEAALEASGLLTAAVLAEGELRDPGTGEVILRAGSPSAARSLRDVLRVELPSDAGVEAGAVEAVLASIALADGDDPAPVWVSATGLFRMGPAYGAWSKDRARYIGETAREAERVRRLAEAGAELAQLDLAIEAASREIAAVGERLGVVDREAHGVPEPRALEAAERADAAARASAAEAETVLVHARERLAEARHVRDERAGELRSDAELLGLPADAAAVSRVAEALVEYQRAADRFWNDTERFADARAARVDAERRLADQTTNDAAAAEELATATEVARTQRAYAESLRAEMGAGVAEYRERVAAVTATLERLKRDISRAEKDQHERENHRATLEERIRGLRELQELAAEARRDVVEQLRRTTELGLAGVAVPELEIPDASGEWTATRGVQFARAVDAALDGVDSSDARYDRLTSEVHNQITELQRSLGRHDYEVASLPREAGVRVFVSIRGSETDLPQLASDLAEQIEQHERLLSVREREIIENHLVTEVGAQLSELIGESDRQIVELNDELRRRPTSTGMLLRVLWKPRPDGPAGLAEARRLLGTASEVWSEEDRATLGAFLQARIAEVRTADESGNWYDHLGEALDYRRWHGFSVQRKQGDAWRPATGPASGGERVLAASIPLFAAASSHYRTAANPHAPRLIMLDEAFAGVDDDSRANCLGLLAEFDLDVVMTSEREWGCYSEVPGLSIAQLSRFGDTPAVHVQLWRWNGSRRTEVAATAPPADSGELW